jgi:hypothetical protein
MPQSAQNLGPESIGPHETQQMMQRGIFFLTVGQLHQRICLPAAGSAVRALRSG